MARHWCVFERGWGASAWSRADGLWKRESPEEAAAEQARWQSAASEDGPFYRVLWCELCQFMDDARPRYAEAPADPPPGHPGP